MLVTDDNIPSIDQQHFSAADVIDDAETTLRGVEQTAAVVLMHASATARRHVPPIS